MAGVMGSQTDAASPVLVTICVNWIPNASKLHQPAAWRKMDWVEEGQGVDGGGWLRVRDGVEGRMMDRNGSSESRMDVGG